MAKRYTFSITLSGIGETKAQAITDALDSFSLDPDELEVEQVELLDENYEVIPREGKGQKENE